MSKIARAAAEEIAEAILDNPGAHMGRAAWVGEFRVITDRHLAPPRALMGRLARIARERHRQLGHFGPGGIQVKCPGPKRCSDAKLFTDYEAWKDEN